jgi:hypothetical protein
MGIGDIRPPNQGPILDYPFAAAQPTPAPAFSGVLEGHVDAQALLASAESTFASGTTQQQVGAAFQLGQLYVGAAPAEQTAISALVGKYSGTST